jgi:hypothetical protein
MLFLIEFVIGLGIGGLIIWLALTAMHNNWPSI